MRRVSVWPVLALIVVIGIAVLWQALFVVTEGQQAIILQFGEYIRTVQEPGLHFRVPFIQTPIYFERRVLMADGRADEYLTLDKKRLVVDHISRWRIVDPFTFYQTVRTEAGALARLDQIITSKLRQEIANVEFIEVIREERENVMQAVTDEVRQLAHQFGVEVLDVRIKRLDLPPEVQDSVFARMEAERRRIALRYRAEGEEAAREIRGGRGQRAGNHPCLGIRAGREDPGRRRRGGRRGSTPKRTVKIRTFTASSGVWRPIATS